jgi:ABC-2 type transport system permease protein
VKQYFTFFKNEFANTVVYRGPVLVWISSNILALLVITAVWTAADTGQTIASYTKAELISYYVVSFFLNWIINWLPIYSTVEEMRSGEIASSTLIKPISFYWRKFSEELGWHAFSTILGTIFTLIIIILFRQYLVLSFPWERILPAILATISAIFVIFEFSLCLGLLAFWFTDVWALDGLFWAGKAFLGGQVLPISFFSSYLAMAIKLLPFRYMLSFPLEIYFGKLSPLEIITGFLIASFWILFFALLYKIMWNRGRKAYTSFGQ